MLECANLGVRCRVSSGLDVPQDAIQVLDVALKQGASNNALCSTVSRNFFFEGSGSFPISGGAEVRSLQALLIRDGCSSLP